MAKTLEFPALGLFCNYTSGKNEILIAFFPDQ
ncbi:MAG: hypothetical protein K0S31_1637 [Sphingobacterium multivorum]|jgi:hypothetical protein|nr:hypothetical protein [Sphingobacterium multivorum]